MYTYIFIYRLRSLPGIEALIYTHTQLLWGLLGPINETTEYKKSSDSPEGSCRINNINTFVSCRKSVSESTGTSWPETGLHFPACSWSLRGSFLQDCGQPLGNTEILSLNFHSRDPHTESMFDEPPTKPHSFCSVKKKHHYSLLYCLQGCKYDVKYNRIIIINVNVLLKMSHWIFGLKFYQEQPFWLFRYKTFYRQY